MDELSIRVRLALAYTLVFGILLAALAAGLYRTTDTRLHRQLDADLENRANDVRLVLTVSESQVAWLQDRETVEQSSPLTAHAIFDRSGNFLEGSALASLYSLRLPESAHIMQSPSNSWETIPGRRQNEFRVFNLRITGSDGQPYFLRVATPMEQVDDELRRLLTSIVALVPLVLLVGGLAGWWLAGHSLEPVARITETAGRISALNLAERLPLRGTNDELDRLSARLNEMISRLQGSFEQMSQFLSNVSHELRTPLAAVRGRCEMALRTAKSAGEFRDILQDNIEIHDRMAKTVSDLLALARAEAGQTILQHQQENLEELVRDLVESTRPLAESRGVTLHYQASGEVIAEVDPTHTMRMLMNVLDNAIKYNVTDGKVRVTVKGSNGWAHISVADTGRGIAREDLPHVFDRFYRVNIEGASSVGGTGLGLGLARWVAAAHGGRIEVESEVGKGSCFEVWLPVRRCVSGASAPTYAAYVAATRDSESSPTMKDASTRRRTKMLHQLVRFTYWVGVFCAIVALIWRALHAAGMPDRIVVGASAIGYNGFINGAFLFLLAACATMAYASASKE